MFKAQLFPHRFLNRVANHPILRKDDSFRDFLENPDEVSEKGARFIRVCGRVLQGAGHTTV